MADKPTITGPQGAMIYLAESLSDLKNEQRRTNDLLRELIELARIGAAAPSFATEDEEQPEDQLLKEMRGLVTPVPTPK